MAPRLKSIYAVFATVLALTGCSKASSVADLNIAELKGVSFGESKQELASTLSSYQLSPCPDQEDCTVFTCDGLEATYRTIKFNPHFLLTKKGKLVKINGSIDNSDPIALAQLQSDLDGKFGEPQVKNLSRIWSDGGVRIALSSLKNNNGAFDFIEFCSPDY